MGLKMLGKNNIFHTHLVQARLLFTLRSRAGSLEPESICNCGLASASSAFPCHDWLPVCNPGPSWAASDHPRFPLLLSYIPYFRELWNKPESHCSQYLSDSHGKSNSDKRLCPLSSSSSRSPIISPRPTITKGSFTQRRPSSNQRQCRP